MDKDKPNSGVELLLKLRGGNIDLVKKILLDLDYDQIKDLIEKYDRLKSIYDDTYFWRGKIARDFAEENVNETNVKKLRAIYYAYWR